MRDQGAVVAVGMFDGLHRGHQVVVDTVCAVARRRGLRALLLTFSQHPLMIVAPEKSPKLLSTIEERRTAALAAGVDSLEVLHFDDELRSTTSVEFVEMLRKRYSAQVLVMGTNNHIGSDRAGAAQLAILAPEIEVIPIADSAHAQGISSTAIRAALSEGDISLANQYLGREYALGGRVVPGKRLGRLIGFPTANIEVDTQKLIPANGVYAVDVIIPDEEAPRRGMVNIGHRPTVDAEGSHRSIEVNIFDYEGDLYGQKIILKFMRRLRDEQQFSSVDALVAQLILDRRASLEI